MFNLKVGDIVVFENGKRKIVMYSQIDEDELGNQILDIRVSEGFQKIPNQRGKLQRVMCLSKENVYPEILDGNIVIRGLFMVYGYKNLALRLKARTCGMINRLLYFSKLKLKVIKDYIFEVPNKIKNIIKGFKK